MGIPFISVVVPVLNGQATIKDCVKSLLSQSYPSARYEIIIVDNGSTDRTIRILNSCQNSLRLLRETKKGSYAARNTGISCAAGSIIAFTDSDCIADKDWLIHISKPFQIHKSVAVGGKITASNKDSPFRCYCDEYCHDQEAFMHARIPFFATSNVAFRKTDINHIGGFQAFYSGGDFELFFRFQRFSRTLFYEPKAVIRHVYSDSILAFMAKQYSYGEGVRRVERFIGTKQHVEIPGPAQLLFNASPEYAVFRLLQGISYAAGYLMGKRKVS